MLASTCTLYSLSADTLYSILRTDMKTILFSILLAVIHTFFFGIHWDSPRQWPLWNSRLELNFFLWPVNNYSNVKEMIVWMFLKCCFIISALLCWFLAETWGFPTPSNVTSEQSAKVFFSRCVALTVHFFPSCSSVAAILPTFFSHLPINLRSRQWPSNRLCKFAARHWYASTSGGSRSRQSAS